jgi:predicted MFS family arabinose efflux permease
MTRDRPARSVRLPVMRPLIDAGPWAAWSLVAAAYLVVFLQRLAPPAILDRLMNDLGVGAKDVALVISAYFMGYVMMQLPAGIVVDRWGPRSAVIVSLTVSTVGTLAFAGTTSLTTAAGCRAAVGLADALIWSSLIKIAEGSFPSSRFGRMAALSQAWGFAGGLIATTPLALLVSAYGWRSTFSGMAYVLGANLALVVLFVADPRGPKDAAVRTVWNLVQTTWSILPRPTTWAPIVTSVGVYVSLMSLSGAWGIPLFMHVYSMSRSEASVPLFVFMLTYTAGCILGGYVADKYLASLRQLLIVMGVTRLPLLLWMTVAVAMHLPSDSVLVCLVGLGLLGGGTIPVVTVALRRAFEAAGIATAIGIKATTMNIASALIQPLLGGILDYYWDGEMLDGARRYTSEGYSVLMFALIAVASLSIIGPLMMRRPVGVTKAPIFVDSRSQ